MKKIAQIAIMFFVMITLFSCSNGSEIKEPTQNPDGNGTTTNPEEKPTTPGGSTGQGTQGDTTLLKFDFQNASVIASVEATQAKGRAAADTMDNAPLVAIEENGSTRPVIISDYLDRLPKIEMLAKAPTADSEYVYIVFEYEPRIYIENETTKEDEYGNKYTYTESTRADIGRVLCVHEDGTFTNVVSNGESFEYFNNELQFDGDGNLYYCTSDSGKGSYNQIVCKYNPQTNTKTRISAPIEGTSYSKMQISNDGAWLFVQGSRYGDGSNTNFLRAIPTASPANYKNLYYNSNWGDCRWIYHNENVYVAMNNKIQCFYKENGAYSQEACETILGNDGNTAYFSIYEMMESHWTYDYHVKELTTVYGYDDSYNYGQYKDKEFYLINDDGNINATELLNAFLYSLTRKFADAGNYLSISELSEKYDFRFDKFAAVEGYELFAELAAGKKNEESFAAVFSSQEVINTLGNSFNNGNRYSYDYSIESYRNNFLADILYLKDTDMLLDEKDPNFFTKKGGGNYYSEHNMIDFYYQEMNGYDAYNWRNDYKNDDGSVNAQKVLDTFFAACNRNGEKEFRLSAFKDDEKYGALYSELKDTDAIEFISQSSKRMNLLYDCADNNCYDFLAKTCFIKGTDKPAYTESNEYWSGSIETFAAINYGSLYAVARTWDNSNYIYRILKLVDSNGNQCAEWIDCDVTISGTSKLIPSGNSFYFKNPILTSGGDETGFQKLLSLNADTGDTVDLLKNADGGSDNLEITSFSADVATVYFSAVRGIDIVNGMVNTATLKVTPVSSNAKFTNILSLK